MDRSFARAVPHVRDPAGGPIGIPLADGRGEAERQRRSNIRLALVIGMVALGFYVLMFVTGWFRW